eukprot:gene1772-biopygen15415
MAQLLWTFLLMQKNLTSLCSLQRACHLRLVPRLAERGHAATAGVGEPRCPEADHADLGAEQPREGVAVDHRCIVAAVVEWNVNATAPRYRSPVNMARCKMLGDATA